MAKNFIENGQTIDFIAQADVVSGQAVVVGALVVVAHGDIKSGEQGVGHAQGVFELTKASGTAIEQGADVYLTSGEIGTDTAGDYAGKAWGKAESVADTVWVALNFGAPSVAAEPSS